jgi:hypothetical protein
MSLAEWDFPDIPLATVSIQAAAFRNARYHGRLSSISYAALATMVISGQMRGYTERRGNSVVIL